jgi:hypothetical protein
LETKKKVKDKWLGEILHEDGVGASVHATIVDREGKVKGVIKEAIPSRRTSACRK